MCLPYLKKEEIVPTFELLVSEVEALAGIGDGERILVKEVTDYYRDQWIRTVTVTWLSVYGLEKTTNNSTGE